MEGGGPDLPTLFQRGVEFHRAGQFREAATLYDQILRYAPFHADTLHLRGFAAYCLGEHDVAHAYLVKAIHQQENHPVYLAHLGLIHQARGEKEFARDAFKKALAVDANQCDALAGLGALDLAAGRFEQARDFLLRSLSVNGSFVAAWSNLAHCCYQLKDFVAAEQASRRALELDPHSREARFQLALVRRSLGNNPDSEREYRRLLQDHPKFLPGLVNLANLVASEERWEEAESLYREGLSISPESVEFRFGLATVLHHSGRWEAALAEYECVLHQDPKHAEATSNLGSLLRNMGRHVEAVALLTHGTALDASNPLVWTNLGNALAESGAWEEARESYRRGSLLAKGDWLSRLRMERLSPLLFENEQAIDAERRRLSHALDELHAIKRPMLDQVDLSTANCEPSFNIHFHGGDDRPLQEKHARLFDGYITPINPEPRRGSGPPHIGFVVTDTHEPIFIRSMMEIINRLHPASLRVSICCSNPGRKIIEPLLRRPGTLIIPLPSQFPAAANRLVEASFDLLYYWEVGTDSLNYCLPFVKAAPVQCTSWGRAFTSGQRVMDYYLSCRWIEPENAADHYTEKLVLFDSFPSTQERINKPESPMSREELGIAPDDHLYVCAQNPGKYHPAFRRAVAEILDRDSSGRLVLTGSKHHRIQEELRELLRKDLGAAFSRLVLLPSLSRREYHRLIAASDVQIDPFPFVGANSSYDGFSMNRPIVTLEGPYQRCRYTAGFYRVMGLEDWICHTPAEFVGRALEWGTDKESRAHAEWELSERTDLLFGDPKPAVELEAFFLSATSTG
ncbi:tetratricopeptide repeat protein [bacterium]|nr:tetratricopeptide repeat protein [bacterium]